MGQNRIEHMLVSQHISFQHEKECIVKTYNFSIVSSTIFTINKHVAHYLLIGKTTNQKLWHLLDIGS